MSHPSMGDGFPDDDDDDDDDDGFDPDEYDDDDEYEDDEHTGGPVPKPAELLALDSVTAELFATLRRWFDVPPTVSLDLKEVDSAVSELGDPQMVAALAMRKLQALNLLATPGVRTTTDVVVAIVNDLERAMVQAPNMWLKRQAAATDWDRAFEALESGEVEGLDEAPVEADEVDPEVHRFRTLHGALHDAMFAVIEISRGEIREFE
ncbi:MAG: hypothetical protein KA758_06115 [Acidimicrobiales bacterium]|nr:hypothetical protein [Acidimicrobiales bacterium]HMS87355.1 hypothetical protein [Acidimicrobiales bacterium]